MSNVRQKLLEEIANKAKRIKEKRIEAANNKTLEAYIFEFFRQVDEANQHNLESYFIVEAAHSLEGKVRSIDDRAKIEIVWLDSDTRKVQGVTVKWSPLYIKANNIDPSIYIDVSQMLFS